MTMVWSDYRVCVTGGAGFLGRVVRKQLLERGVLPGSIIVPRRPEYDLTNERDVRRLYQRERPDVVLHLAAEVGGIGANMTNPGRFFYANMAMGLHLVEQARLAGIRKFVHVSTVCAYPKLTEVPFKEADLWNGYPEDTNAPYGIAKKALIVMLDAYHRQYGLNSAVVIPTNLYGPGDNFDPNTSHVIPALIRKFSQAQLNNEKHVVCWGTGRASREFLHVNDAAAGVILAAEIMEVPLPINLGTGREVSIADLAYAIARLCDYSGEIIWDSTKPDGQPRRCLNTAVATALLGWQANTPFIEGLTKTIAWWRSSQSL